MYGMVNQAIRDLVVSKFGEEKWGEVCKAADVGDSDFVSMNYYPDQLTYGLVGAASKVLGLSAEVILSEFGRYWVLYTAKEGYGPLMDLFGADFKSCLENLNNLHARMGMTMPKLSPPRFVFQELGPRHFELSYQSTRAGLSPMVSGLLAGLAEKYGVKASIQPRPRADESAPVAFDIRLEE